MLAGLASGEYQLELDGDEPGREVTERSGFA